MTKAIVLKDQVGNYVCANSLEYINGKVVYTYSKSHINGFYYTTDLSKAEAELDKLNQLQAVFQIEGKQFHIEEIDSYAVLKEESKSEVSKDPFVHEYYDIDKKGGDWVWVLKDSKGNYTHGNGVKMWDKKTYIYVSYKRFICGCKGYGNLRSAETAKDKLETKIKKMGLDETFTLKYVNFKSIIKKKDPNDNTDGMVVVERQVA